MTTVYERLKALQITLPEPSPGGGWLRCRFRSVVRTGNLVYLSGRLAKKDASLGSAKWGSKLPHSRQTSRTRHCHRSARHAASRPRDLDNQSVRSGDDLGNELDLHTRPNFRATPNALRAWRPTPSSQIPEKVGRAATRRLRNRVLHQHQQP